MKYYSHICFEALQLMKSVFFQHVDLHVLEADLGVVFIV